MPSSVHIRGLYGAAAAMAGCGGGCGLSILPKWGGAAVKMATAMKMAVAMAEENEKRCRKITFYAFILSYSFRFPSFHMIAYDNNYTKFF